MPAVRCPVPGCDYITDDVDSAIVVALINAHSASHTGGEAVKVEHVGRPTTTAAGSGEDVKSPIATARAESVDEKMLKQSGLKICFKYNGRGCERVGSCSYIHICKSYVKGVCGSGKCSRSHDICDPAVISALDKHGINTKKPKREILAEFKAAIKDNESMSSRGEGGNSEDRLEDISGGNANRTKYLKLCHKYNGSGCERDDSCPYIHMCRTYVESKCGKECSKNHNIFDPRVKEILEKHGVDINRKPKEILADIKVALKDDRSKSNRDESRNSKAESVDVKMLKQSGPKICFKYNGRGCERVDSCSYIHICMSYVKGVCVSGKCSRSHDICDPAVISALDKHGINTKKPRREILADFQAAIKDNESMSSRGGGGHSEATRTSSRKIICLFNLRGRCRWKYCPNVHSELPYQWRWKSLSEKDWIILSEHEYILVEHTYSDPSNRGYTLASETGVNITFDFQTMTGTGTDRQTDTSYIIRRISTPSAVEYTRDRWATVWQWYWKNEDGKWIKYGNMTGPSNIRQISNNDIEQAYINNPEGQIACGGKNNFIDFSWMTQIDVADKTVVEVCRRPTFVSEREAKEKRRQLDLKLEQKVPVSSTVDLSALPPNWKVSPGEDISDHRQLTTLQDSDTEYKEIESLFYECPPAAALIKSIKRIENGDLWENYVSRRTKMLKKKSKEEVGERRVFHGTKNQYIDPIWHQGFDFRLSGETTGTLYGKGCYIATSSKYSDYYADVGEDIVMFVAKILPGAYVRGKKEYKRPPHKDEGNLSSELYDSCVDDESNPQKFVIFDNNQIYPEYLITYNYLY
ncbi:protein mono-ADP-ribosyltransferase PARP12-like [Mercenaria mercenaria]|uniref:protein mono-ADP-ribosyltransferase PARP12-like n=1 Tax=Mercenaria mercenaria TaxID=6596 RepID=UPI00234E833A|nr:protein mono-ADP-ribosyltransferase PARP12-like [Mercenaria mercenaria]